MQSDLPFWIDYESNILFQKLVYLTSFPFLYEDILHKLPPQLLQASPELMEFGSASSDWWPLVQRFTGDLHTAESAGTVLVAKETQNSSWQNPRPKSKIQENKTSQHCLHSLEDAEQKHHSNEPWKWKYSQTHTQREREQAENRKLCNRCIPGSLDLLDFHHTDSHWRGNSGS